MQISKLQIQTRISRKKKHGEGLKNHHTFHDKSLKILKF